MNMENSIKSYLIFPLSLACSLIHASQVFDSNEKISSDNRPNIIMIVCEDISPYLGCFGDEIAVTPYLDSFSTQAIRHFNMFTSVGVSAPSRYSLITGRYSSTDGANYMRSNYFNKEFEVVSPSGVKCYTELMRAQGYYCTNNAKTDYQFLAPLAAWDEQGAKAHWKNTPQGQPFFSIFNLNSTHESQIWKNKDKPLCVNTDDIIIPPYYPDTEVVRHDHAVLYTNIKKMDEQFFDLLSELDNSEYAQNTIVIFYSDNGGPLPRGKRELMDSGTRVPFMIRFPNNYKSGRINDELNMFVDIPATILSLAGIAPPDYMHGKAMYGKYKAKKNRKYVFGATDRFDEQIEKRASIRDERYQYIYNYMPQQSVYRPVEFRLSMPMMKEMLELYKNGVLNDVQSYRFNRPTHEEELYDCINDPYQINNLIDNPQYSKILKKMRASFRREWINPYNIEWENQSEDYFINTMWPNGTKPQCESIQLELINNKIKINNDLSIYTVSFCKGKETKWNLYTSALDISVGESIKFRIERIGHIPAEIVFENKK